MSKEVIKCVYSASHKKSLVFNSLSNWRFTNQYCNSFSISILLNSSNSSINLSLYSIILSSIGVPNEPVALVLSRVSTSSSISTLSPTSKSFSIKIISPKEFLA